MQIVIVEDEKESEKEKPVKEKVNDSDPCHGKPKEFFIYDFDPRIQLCVLKVSQVSFLSTYYPDS